MTLQKIKSWLNLRREFLLLILLLAGLYMCARVTYHFYGHYTQQLYALQQIEKITRLLMYGK